MLFGFAVAVIAGFLLTAVGNWTQRETLVGAPLLALAGLWVLGRVALAAGGLLPRIVVAGLDLAFLPALAVAIGRPLVATANRRNYVMLAVLAGLWLADLTVHLDALGVLPGWRRRGNLLAVDLVLVVIVIVAARIFPMFTRNATQVASIRAIPALDAVAAAAMIALTLLDAALPGARVTPVVAAVAAVAVAARSATWGARHTRTIPLLWILHLGHAWIPVGLALRAVAAWTPAVPVVLATHALTIGAIGGLTLGMMSRVALGHSGRPLTASRLAHASFVLVSLAALARTAIPLAHPAWYRASLFVAGALWTAAFAIFTVVYLPILATPRADGKPG
jgi:uncharacterized protein involved in response to NO